MSEIKRAVAICHYNRLNNLTEIVEAVLDTTAPGTKVFVCDDGSTKGTGAFGVKSIIDYLPKDIILIRGPNKGVAANKNRALWAMQDCQYMCILEDDLIPTEKGWFETYEEAARRSNIHHFCRVQDKQVEETVSNFSKYMQKHSLTPIYGPSPRGDLTFITSSVLRAVGAFNPLFSGAGYAHGEFSSRVYKAGLIKHPLKWIDIREAQVKFKQIGDTEGGRWVEEPQVIKRQLQKNAKIRKDLEKTEYVFHPLVLE